MRLQFAGMALAVCGSFNCAAQQQPTTMTKMVVRLTGSGIKPGSIAAMPRTIYAAGPHYARIENPPDARQGIQKLIIIAEPDAYSVNLIDKKGTHAIDQGGPNDVHLPIVFDPAHKLPELRHLEFGDELAFFEDTGAQREPGPAINSQPTGKYRLQVANGSATLIVKAATQTPVSVNWQSGGETFTYEYFVYEKTPFNPSLFMKPKGIAFREIPSEPASDLE